MKATIRSVSRCQLTLLFLLLLVTGRITSQAAEWYVDGAASGANTGTNWHAAWTNFASIAWPSINPGDTIYLSGGTSGRTYHESFVVGKEGTPDRPITIRTSQEIGHNGLVTVNAGDRNGFAMRDWVTVTGAKDDTYAARFITNTVNVPLITNNIGLRVIAANGFNYTRSGPRGMRILWVDISSSADRAQYFGIRIRASPPYDQRDSEIAYCWIHDIGQDGITGLNFVPNPAFDQLVVHHCLIERVGDDGLEVNQGVTVHHCIIRDTRAVRGHPDGIQSVGSYQRYFNNIFSDFSSSYLVTQGVATDTGVYGPIQIYGNLFYANQRPSSATMIELKWFPLNWNVASNITYGNWVFANNTLVGSTNGAYGIYKRDNLLTNVMLRSIRWVNNITYDTYSWVGGIPHGPDRLRTGFWHGPPEEIVFDYNVIARGTRRGSPRNTLGATEFSIFGRKWPNAQAMSRVTIYKHNTSAAPRFVDEFNHDYRLASDDTVARDTGLDLSSLGLPGLERDIYGNVRGFGGAWDRGAIEYVPFPPVKGGSK